MKILFTQTLTLLGKDPKNFNADVHFVTPDEIRALNLKWRGVDKATGVLSFPLGEFNPATGKTELGDIVICRDYAEDLSDEYLYLHGLLHLLGYTHDTDEDEARMDAIIREVLGL